MKYSVIAALAARSRRIKALVLFAASSAVLAGCFTGSSPYDYMDGWLIRDDAHMAFVDDEMVQRIRDDISRARYRNVWGRDMPGK